MAGALVFLVGQLFLFGTTSAQCPFPCSDCKEFPDGDNEGTWNLKAEIDSRCIGSCLYQRDSDGKEMCFCDPGPTEYVNTCLERKWDGPLQQIWGAACANVTVRADYTLGSCKAICTETCNAIEFNSVSFGCITKACPLPPPQPKEVNGNWRGYKLET